MVLTLISLNIIITIILVNRMMNNTRQLAEIDEPIKEAVLEMEINASETARAVFDYIWDHEVRDLERMLESEHDFERYYKKFDRLVETEEEKSLGRKVYKLYQDFNRLGHEIIDQKDQQLVNFQTFTAYTEKTNELIGESLRESIDFSDHDAIEKILAISLMDEILDEFVWQIMTYIYANHHVLKQEIMKVDELFNSYHVRYLETYHSVDNEKWLDLIKEDFSNAVRVGNEIVTLTDQMHDKLERFEDNLYEIDRILDDDIQILVNEQITRAKNDAMRSGKTVIVFLVISGILIIVFVACIGRFVSKGIINATDRLTEGADQFSKGKLDHRIEVLTKDELGTLTDVFNKMADTLQKTTISRDELVKEVQYRKQVEHAYIELFESGPIAYHEIDLEGKIVRVNQTELDLLGYTREEMIGLPVSEFTSDPEVSRDAVRKKMENEIVLEGFDRKYRHKDGSLINVYIDERYIYDNKRCITGIRSAMQDITERKKIERSKFNSDINRNSRRSGHWPEVLPTISITCCLSSPVILKWEKYLYLRMMSIENISKKSMPPAFERLIWLIRF